MNTTFHKVTAQLAAALKSNLPGHAAHRRMESDYRRLQGNAAAPTNPKQSAVLFLLYPDEQGEACAAFILRQKNLSIHSNQISLPGGRTEETDASFEETALRETHEEIGVSAAGITVIGKLTEVWIPRSGFMVHPYVGMCAARPQFTLQTEEVADVYDVKLADLFHHENKSTYHITDAEGNQYTAPSYLIAGRHLWGATAMMMAEVEDILSHNIM